MTFNNINLNLNQQRFVEEYIKTGNATQSYKTAYNQEMDTDTAKANGCRLLTNDNIKEAIEAKNREIADNSIATVAEIKRYLSDMLRNAEKPDKTILKAAELLLKTEGAFLDRAQIQTDGTVTLELMGDTKTWAE